MQPFPALPSNGDSQHLAACSMVARQPILDSQCGLVAYELLYRGGDADHFPDGVRSEQATLQLLAEQFLTYQCRILDGHKGYVNFDQQSLLRGVPLDFPCEDIVIEVLETCEPTDALFTALSELVRQGYVLALDDFEPSPDWARFYPLVSVIKLDVQTLPFRHCTQIIQRLKGTGIVFLAEKVETYQEFHQAIKCGFSLFQGYFFQKPEVIRRKKIASSTLDLFKLSSLVSKRNIDHSAVNVVISRNPVFSVQLLKFVNAGVQLRTPIKDIEQSLHYLGDDRIRKFVSYTAISALAPGKPDVLLYHSLQRAKCLEALAGVTEGSCDPASAYLCGLMSLVDGMLDMPLEAILAQLAIAPNIVEALTERRGRLGDFLRVVEALERSDWPKLATQAQLLSLDEEQILSCHYLASEWASEVQQRA